MNNLFVAWGTTFLVGIVFRAMDVVFLPFLNSEVYRRSVS